jgi:chaperonin cofactor prefoldin
VSKNGEVNPDEVLQDLLDLATEKVPSSLSKSVKALNLAHANLQSHIDCAQGDLQQLAADFQTKRHCLNCAIKDLAALRAELVLISDAAKAFREEILTIADTAQIAILIGPLLDALSVE